MRMMLDAVPANGNRGPLRVRAIALLPLMAALALAALPAVPAVDGPASAQETAPHQVHPEAREAIAKIRSPYCPGQMLEVCPSWQAAELRDSIDQMAREGLEADSLVELVVAAHGEEYRALPKRTGTGLLAWVMPPAALLMGLAVVVVVLRRLRGAAVAGEGTAGDISEEDRERLDAALAELEAMEEME